MLDKEPEEAEMLVMIPNIQNLKGNRNEERWISLHYNTTRLLCYTLLLSVSNPRKGGAFSPSYWPGNHPDCSPKPVLLGLLPHAPKCYFLHTHTHTHTFLQSNWESDYGVFQNTGKDRHWTRGQDFSSSALDLPELLFQGWVFHEQKREMGHPRLSASLKRSLQSPW